MIPEFKPERVVSDSSRSVWLVEFRLGDKDDWNCAWHLCGVFPTEGAARAAVHDEAMVQARTGASGPGRHEEEYESRAKRQMKFWEVHIRFREVAFGIFRPDGVPECS